MGNDARSIFIVLKAKLCAGHVQIQYSVNGIKSEGSCHGMLAYAGVHVLGTL